MTFLKQAEALDGIDRVGALVGAGDLVPFRGQARYDTFGIDQRLGAAQADDADFGRCVLHGA